MMNTKTTHEEPGLGRVLREDMGHGDFFHTMRREWAELKEYFLSDQRKQQLRAMNPVKRLFFIPWWLIKSLLLKLNWIRRLFLLASFYFMFFPIQVSEQQGEVTVSQDTHWLGFAIIVFVLMLELKDKLLAKDELAAGRTVQKALMPDKEPRIKGWSVWLHYQPANEVCGDLLDFMSIDNQRAAIALGDVSDKGLGAALLMVKLQATLRALAPDHTSLSQLAEKMNKIYLRDGVAKSFASLVYLEMQPEGSELRLFNAGHLPPLLIKDEAITELPKGDMGLGISGHAAFKEQNLSMNSGDLLVVFSDGLTEARNEAGEFYGDQRLWQAIKKCPRCSASRLGEAILQQLDRFTEEALPHDDLSLAIIMKE
jgi:hypothetical protein